VTRPSYYGGPEDPYEVVKVIEAWDLNFQTGNAVKYIRRAGEKDPAKHVDDLTKAITYLELERDRVRRAACMSGDEAPGEDPVESETETADSDPLVRQLANDPEALRLAKLVEANTEKDPKTGERKVKASPAMRRNSARRARQAKLAKRCGMTRDEFVAAYGDVDRIPEGAPAKVIKYRPKAKKDAG